MEKYLYCFIILFLDVVNLYVNGNINDVCEQCVPISECKVFGEMSSRAQQTWLAKFSCQPPRGRMNSTSKYYGFGPVAKGDFVCCSNVIWGLQRSSKLAQNGRSQNSQASGSTIKPLISGPTNTAPEDPLFNSADNNARIMPRAQVPATTARPSFRAVTYPGPNPYFPVTGSTNAPVNTNGNINGQCSVATSFPPDPDTGCCGLEAIDTNRLAGGTETELYQFPWTVLLKTTFNYGNRAAAFSCGGALISSRYVLTAGHCVFDSNGTVSNIEVRLSEYDTRTFPVDCKMVFGVGRMCIQNIIMYAENVILHPLYDDSMLYNDIALIRLRGNAPYTDYIRPICLPPINIDDPQFSNLRLAVAGWGRNGSYASHLKQSTVVNLAPQQRCRKYYPALTNNQLCAVGFSGEDTCKGDSGGPLMTVYGGKYFVVGLVSGKRADAPCGTSVPSLYTNVYRYLDWIQINLRN